MATIKLKPAPLRLYVWEGVLTDYTSGIAFALARSVEQARKLLIAEDPSVAGELSAEPIVCRSPCAFTCAGGG